jgi:uncharacterized damage-inducible protein DinB
MGSFLYRVQDRYLLTGFLRGEGGFHSPAVVLSGLTPAQAAATVHGLPHSIAGIVGHMWFYQDYFNRCAASGFQPFPQHAAEGWPNVEPGQWEDIRNRYLASIAEAKRIVETSTTLDEKLLPDGVPMPFLAKESFGSGLLHAVVHNGHHLGQIVTIRQLMGLWPPESGSMTW